jgi:hypothetical protein
MNHAVRVLQARLALDRNLLRRRSDRLEALALAAAIVIALVAVPLAVIAGTREVDQLTWERLAQEPRLHVSATLVADPVEPVTADQHSSPYARLRWQTSTGASNETDIAVLSGMRRGDRMRIWVTPDGRLSTPLITRADVIMDAVSTILALAAFGL